jgi:hypothetical protein
MKLATNYGEMSDSMLLEELLKRLDAFGDLLPTYTDGMVRITYNDNEYFFGDAEGSDFTMSEYGGYDQFILAGYGEGEAIKKDDPRYRELLLLFLQAPFTIFTYSEEQPPVSQEEFLEDYDEV